MMKVITNAMRLQAARQSKVRRETEVGTVTSYDPSNYAVRVTLQVDGTLTGWMPLASPWIGNGWGMFAAPSIGDMVSVEFFGGALEAGFVEGRLFNDDDRPLAVPSGEFWLVHQSGSFLKFTDKGDVLVTCARDLSAVVGRNMSANVTGDLSTTVGGDATANVTGSVSVTATAATITAPTTIDGDLTVNGAITGSSNITAAGDVADQGGAKTMAAMRTEYNAHKGHGTPGSGNTPDHFM